jgi:hypothetical protein
MEVRAPTRARTSMEDLHELRKRLSWRSGFGPSSSQSTDLLRARVTTLECYVLRVEIVLHIHPPFGSFAY